MDPSTRSLVRSRCDVAGARPRHSPSAARSALVAALAALACLVLAAPAAAAGRGFISDFDATPSFTWTWGSPVAADRAAAAVIMPDGSVYVAGDVFTPTGHDATLMKLKDGAPVWPAPKTFDGPAHSEDVSGALAAMPDGSLVSAGITVAANGSFDWLVVKWSAGGSVKWVRTWDGPEHGSDFITGLGVDGAGNVTVSGGSGTPPDEWSVVSWTSAGKKRWSWRWAPSGSMTAVPLGLVVAPDASVYVTGLRQSATAASMENVRLSKAGRLLWHTSYLGPEGLGAVSTALVDRPGGGVYVAGTTLSAVTGTDGMVVRLTPKGKRTVYALDTGPGGATDQDLNDVAVTTTGQVVAVGESGDGVASDAHLVTWAKDGTIAAKLTFPGPSGNDSFDRVAADPFGGYVCAGTYYSAANKSQFAVVRGSVLPGGGGWLSAWAPAFVSVDNRPIGLAVRDSTAVVVGQSVPDAASGIQQTVLWYVY